MLSTRTTCVLFSLAFALPLASSASPLDLDLTFNGTGTRVVDFGLDAANSDDVAKALALQPDGKLVVVGSVANAGQSDFGLLRLNPDGSLDLAFGGGGAAPGHVVTDIDDYDGANDVLIQPDGKILVVGRTGHASWGSGDIVLARYLPDGSLDVGFGVGGVVRVALGEYETGRVVGLQPDGRIVVLASQERPTPSDPYLSDFLVLRLTTDGQLDTSFADLGIKRIAFGHNWNAPTDMAVSIDGKITVVGITAQLTNLIGDKSFGALARLHSNGSFDASLDGGVPAICAILASCGRVVSDFGGGGFDFPTAVAQRRSNGIEDGKIVVSGRFGVARYLANGALDVSFSGNGVNTMAVNTGADIAIRSDGSIVRVGESSADFGVAIYASDGALDTFCGPGNQSSASTDYFGLADRANGVAISATGEIVAAGIANDADEDFAMARYQGGACGNASTLLLSKAFLAYNIFVHPQDKVGPDWPGWLSLLPLERPSRLAVPMARNEFGSSSPYVWFDVQADSKWLDDGVTVATALGTAQVRPQTLNAVLIPAHLATKASFVSRSSVAEGYACYAVAKGARFDEERLLFEDAFGERQWIAASGVTQLCVAINRNQDQARTESQYLACVEAQGRSWSQGAVEFDSAIGGAGDAKMGAASVFCLNAEIRTPEPVRAAVLESGARSTLSPTALSRHSLRR